MLERVAGIEPASSAWKAEVLPLNYTRGNDSPTPGPTPPDGKSQPPPALTLVEGGGFEPPKLARQIYSLIPLATREPLRKGAHSLDVDTLCQQAWKGNSAPSRRGIGLREHTIDPVRIVLCEPTADRPSKTARLGSQNQSLLRSIGLGACSAHQLSDSVSRNTGQALHQNSQNR